MKLVLPRHGMHTMQVCPDYATHTTSLTPKVRVHYCQNTASWPWRCRGVVADDCALVSKVIEADGHTPIHARARFLALAEQIHASRPGSGCFRDFR